MAKKQQTVIRRGGGHWLKEGKTGRSIIRLPVTGAYVTFKRREFS